MSLFIKRKKKSETFNINGKKMHNFPNTPKKKKKERKKKEKIREVRGIWNMLKGKVLSS